MMQEFSTVALVGLYADARVAKPMQRIASHLKKAGITVVTTTDIAAELNTVPVEDDGLADIANLIVAVGGDGTMLHAAALAGDSGVPLLGVNRGRLGFLTDVSPAEMLESIDRILAGNYSRDSRLRLKATLTQPDRTVCRALALNDVVLQRYDTVRMLDFETRVADRFVSAHMGDGLIVATPTGATAYALSCGGPIIEPTLDAIVIVPICPHTLSDRPVVVSSSQHIDVSLLEREDTNAEVSVDGNTLGTLEPGGSLRIEASASRITLIHPPGYDYYEILRSKLNWGRDSRRQTDESDY